MISDQTSYVPVTNIKIPLLPSDQTTISILDLLGKWLPVFREQYLYVPSSHLEDRISKELSAFLQSNSNSFVFQFNDKKGVDFQILIKPYVLWAKPIFMIEAKRLPASNDSKEYVTGKTGGIERFKREQEGFILDRNHCAMVAYIQKNTFDYWFNRVNRWLAELIDDNENYADFNWENSDKLVAITSGTSDIARYISSHSRKTLSKLTIDHFWLDMRVKDIPL